MRGNLVALILFLLMRAAGAQNPRVYYVNGDAYEQITDRGVTVTLRLNEDHGENWLTVYVVNDSRRPRQRTCPERTWHSGYDRLPIQKQVGLDAVGNDRYAH